MKRRIAPFGDGAIKLRLIEESDLIDTLSWRNRDEARVWFKSSNQIALDQHKSWYAQYLNKENDYLFVVEVDGNLVGQVSVYDIDWDNKRAEVGRFLANPCFSGKGYITNACRLLIDFCINELNLQDIYLEVMEENLRAIKIYLALGFIETSKCNGLVRMDLLTNDSES